MTWVLLPAAMWVSQEQPQQPTELRLGMYFLSQNIKGKQSKTDKVVSSGSNVWQAQG